MITRFAPSPTGYLHLGHVVSALYVHALGKYFEAKILLRMEDHDRSRCKKIFEEEIYKDLSWLGLEYANKPNFELDPEFRQSDCLPLYHDALEKLNTQGLIYRCFCSRKTLAQRLGKADTLEGELCYDNYCRNLPKNKQPTAPYVLRLRVAPGDTFFFNEWNRGTITQTPGLQCGDFVVFDKNGCFTYQHCVVIDDIRHGVNLIVRGKDLLSSVGRQLYLTQVLDGAPAEIFFHHKLVESNNEKLSKRKGSFAIKNFRESGYHHEYVIAEAINISLNRDFRRLNLENALELIIKSLEAQKSKRE